LELLDEWTPIDIADALELLSGYFTNEDVRVYAVKQLQRADNEELDAYLLQLVQALRYEEQYPSFLSEFLINRCVQTLNLANFFHWYLSVERYDKVRGQMYARLHKDFLEAAGKTPQGAEWVKLLQAQGQMIRKLITVADTVKQQKGRIDKKIQMMQQLVTEGDLKDLRKFDTKVRMPVRPGVELLGVNGKECSMFKSALAPLLVSFHTPDNLGYKVIFKTGDDLRQDQLIIQMVNLMDSLLKKVKLDLKLTPYRVLATSPDDGFVEYVPNSFTVTSILEKYDKDIRKFFSKFNPRPHDLQRVLDTFVKSCAGYCVITYILGIGDRHLDNVLITNSGHLFHIDFGYIFGRDPKPFPPPMKFCKEMVEAMGGANSAHYRDFRKYCCLAFNILRQSAPLILNLLSLMGDANIPDLSGDVEKNLLKVQEKFRLDLGDEEAEAFILTIIDESVSALFPQIAERIHKWALYWK